MSKLKKQLDQLTGKATGLLRNINEKNIYYVLAVLLLAIFLLDYFFPMKWQLGVLRELNPEISRLSRDLKEAQGDIKRIQEFQEEIENYKIKVQEAHLHIITQGEVPVILEKISRFANKYGVKIDRITPLKEAQKLILENSEGQYYSLPIVMNARGGYHNVGRFLNLIESDDIFLNVVKLDLSKSSDPKMLSLRLSINAVIFEKAGG